MRKPNINKILLITLCLFINLNNVYAANGLFGESGDYNEPKPSNPTPSPSPGTPSNPGTPTNPKPTTPKEPWEGLPSIQPDNNDNKKYECYYSYSVGRSTSLDINAYDMDGNSLIPNILQTDYKFTAGTWMGVNITEIKSAHWEVKDIQHYEIKRYYRCHYKKDSTTYTQYTSCKKSCSGHTGQGSECTIGHTAFGTAIKGHYCYDDIDLGGVNAYGEQEKNPVSYDYKLTKNDCSSRYINGIRVTAADVDKIEFTKDVKVDIGNTDPGCDSKIIDIAIEEARNSVGTPSNKLEISATNQYDKPNNLEIGASKDGELQETLTTPRKGDVKQKYKYAPSNVCMNTLTSEVTYNSECKESNETIEIKDGTTFDKELGENGEWVKYWHYFIPLDAKTGSKQALKLIKNAGNNSKPTLTKKQCIYGMENKPEDYKFYIAPTDGGTFDGNYERGKNTSDEQKVEAGNGCFIVIMLEFDIVQKFYGETSNSNRLKGYGMYFRQIDINNPFPNGLKSSTYWNGLYNESTKKVKTRGTEVKLQTSFDSPTYVANLSSATNIAKVRQLNKDSPYTNWISDYQKTYGMSANGTSNFVRNNNPIFTKVSPIVRKSPYKLGCGPSNYETWKEWCQS